MLIRDWSFTGTTKREGGGGCGVVCEVLPLQKGGGAEKVLALLKGMDKQFWGSFYIVA